MKKMHEIFPNGCSSRQLDILRDSWFEKYGNPYTEGADWSEVKLLDCMYSALGMLESCFAYHGIKHFYESKGWSYNESYYDHYLDNYLEKGGTKEDFDKMIAIQCKHFENSEVVYAGSDWEGCSYNGVLEKDEIMISD